ncbi:MAG: response regulator, partial [Nitrospirae bacterium]|nr:response regulator [Nitrospirota bacterium]
MKVLIADNAEDTKHVLEEILLDKGYECVFIENNADIVEKVYTEVPDIIILDTKPAGSSALKILKKLKSAPSTRDIPVVLIASKKSQSKLAKGYELGAYDYISRPYFKEEITA